MAVIKDLCSCDPQSESSLFIEFMKSEIHPTFQSHCSELFQLEVFCVRDGDPNT